jgi:hypothetical protein
MDFNKQSKLPFPEERDTAPVALRSRLDGKALAIGHRQRPYHEINSQRVGVLGKARPLHSTAAMWAEKLPIPATPIRSDKSSVRVISIVAQQQLQLFVSDFGPVTPVDWPSNLLSSWPSISLSLNKIVLPHAPAAAHRHGVKTDPGSQRTSPDTQKPNHNHNRDRNPHADPHKPDRRRLPARVAGCNHRPRADTRTPLLFEEILHWGRGCETPAARVFLRPSRKNPRQGVFARHAHILISVRTRWNGLSTGRFCGSASDYSVMRVAAARGQVLTTP